MPVSCADLTETDEGSGSLRVATTVLPGIDAGTVDDEGVGTGWATGVETAP